MEKIKIVCLSLLSLILLNACSSSDSPSDTTDPVVNTELPVLTTNTAFTAQYTSSPKSGGTISSDGGSAVTARGIVWSTTTNPTTANSKTVDGTGIGAFTSTMTGLAINTKYYVRAYATNSNGTSYGNQTTITTVNFNVDNTPALMTANINGTQFNFMKPYLYSVTGNDVIVENNGAAAGVARFLKIQGDTSDTIGSLTEINLHIPSTKWVPGTYPLSETSTLDGTSLLCQANIILPYVGGNPDYRTVTGGSITITEFNLTTKRIKGTFNIVYQKSGSTVNYQINNGTFNYGLDASYFN